MLRKRQGIIVWLHSLKHAKILRRFGNVHYVSKRMKYAVLYCNMDEVEKIMAKLRSYSFVKKVEPSFKPFLRIEFENSKPDKAKEYDYRIGL
ncbi:MAG: YlbG family protein [Bacillales bacterium]